MPGNKVKKAERTPGRQWDLPWAGETRVVAMVLLESRCDLDPPVRCNHHQRHDSKQRRERRNPSMRSLHGGYLWHRAEQGRALWAKVRCPAQSRVVEGRAK